MLPHGVEGHDRVSHRERVAGEILRALSAGFRCPAEEGIVFSGGDKVAQRDGFVLMRLRHCRGAQSAVRVETDGKDGFFRPGGVQRDRFALRAGDAGGIVGIGDVHCPVLVVVKVPADEIIVRAGEVQGFGGRQAHRAENDVT